MCEILVGNSSVSLLSDAQKTFFTASAYVMNWHVPVFFMMTGALLLGRQREITPGICLRKYARRVFLALLLFGIPFTLADRFMDAGVLNGRVLWKAFLDIIGGTGPHHLWYLYAIIGIYLMLPVIKRFMDAAERREVQWILAALFLFDFVFPAVGGIAGIEIGFSLPFLYPLFYLIAGRYLADQKPRLFQNKWGCLAALVLIAFFTTICNVTFPVSDTVNGYNGVLTSLSALFAFSLFTGLSVPEKLGGRLWQLDRLCFGVYLVHPLFIHFAFRILRISPASFAAYPIYTAVFFVVFIVLSFFASWVMSLIPPLKKYIL